MKALITGASSGIGKAVAIELAQKNIDLVLVARRQEALEQLKKSLQSYPIHIDVFPCDLKDEKKCKQLVQQFSDAQILINNAGFGDAGDFLNTSLEKELEMIDVNIKAMHILLKTFTQHWKTQKQEAYVLNVASLAAFQAGPKMATYYATKAYVLHLSEAVAFELKKEKLPIHISTLCPGPVATEFNQVANVKFHVKELSPQKVAKLGVKGMFKNKAIIIPGLKGKLGIFFSRFISRKMAQRVVCRVQEKKINGK